MQNSEGVNTISAGNLLGTILVDVAAFAMWLVLGAAIDKIGHVFNYTIRILPSFQDAVTGFNNTQIVWSVILIVVWIVSWVNYALNESNEAGGLT